MGSSPVSSLYSETVYEVRFLDPDFCCYGSEF